MRLTHGYCEIRQISIKYAKWYQPELFPRLSLSETSRRLKMIIFDTDHVDGESR